MIIIYYILIAALWILGIAFALILLIGAIFLFLLAFALIVSFLRGDPPPTWSYYD